MRLVRCACGIAAVVICTAAKHSYGWGVVWLMGLLAAVVVMFVAYTED